MNTKQIMAILAVVVLATAGIGAAYAYSATISNTDNQSDTTYLKLKMDEYQSALDDNSFYLDTSWSQATDNEFGTPSYVFDAADNQKTRVKDVPSYYAIDSDKYYVVGKQTVTVSYVGPATDTNFPAYKFYGTWDSGSLNTACYTFYMTVGEPVKTTNEPVLLNTTASTYVMLKEIAAPSTASKADQDLVIYLLAVPKDNVAGTTDVIELANGYAAIGIKTSDGTADKATFTYKAEVTINDAS